MEIATSAAPAVTHLPRPEHPVASGRVIYSAGDAGLAWRIAQGSVRLDRPAGDSEERFANLAVQGDIIGAETLIFGHYTFTATALSPCVLAPWPEGDASSAGESLLHALGTSQKRMAEVIALRCGQAANRVRGLIHLLALGHGQGHGVCHLPASLTLPSLRDMADITALTAETVSRILSSLRRDGVLQLDGMRRGRHAPKTGTYLGA